MVWLAFHKNICGSVDHYKSYQMDKIAVLGAL